jgi:electron transfer flavoprotein beta subunit
MRIVVCIKQVAALGDDVEFTPDGRAVDPDYLDFALNEWDTYSIEEAVSLRGDGGSGDVIAVCVGDATADAALVRCLATGADRAVRIWSDELEGADPIRVARALAGVVGPLGADLVLCGAQSADSVQGATGTALAALLGLPVVAVVRALELQSGSALVHRELEGGVVDVVEVPLPALLTIQTGINEPRYVTLRAMQAAQQQEIELVEPGSLGEPAYRIRRMLVPVVEKAELIAGGPAEVARRIAELVREASR